MTTLQLVDICNENGQIVEPAWLARAESVHRQLRQRLPENYVERLTRVFGFGARMTIAIQDESVVGVAVWRCYEDTHDGIKFYIDDLVTDEPHRSRGIGKALLARMAEKAAQLGATNLVLDSGTHRHLTHKLYFREGFTIVSYNFKKPLA